MQSAASFPFSSLASKASSHDVTQEDLVAPPEPASSDFAEVYNAASATKAKSHLYQNGAEVEKTGKDLEGDVSYPDDDVATELANAAGRKLKNGVESAIKVSTLPINAGSGPQPEEFEIFHPAYTRNFNRDDVLALEQSDLESQYAHKFDDRDPKDSHCQDAFDKKNFVVVGQAGLLNPVEGGAWVNDLALREAMGDMHAGSEPVHAVPLVSIVGSILSSEQALTSEDFGRGKKGPPHPLRPLFHEDSTVDQVTVGEEFSAKKNLNTAADKNDPRKPEVEIVGVFQDSAMVKNKLDNYGVDELRFSAISQRPDFHGLPEENSKPIKSDIFIPNGQQLKSQTYSASVSNGSAGNHFTDASDKKINTSKPPTSPTIEIPAVTSISVLRDKQYNERISNMQNSLPLELRADDIPYAVISGVRFSEQMRSIYSEEFFSGSISYAASTIAPTRSLSEVPMKQTAELVSMSDEQKLRRNDLFAAQQQAAKVQVKGPETKLEFDHEWSLKQEQKPSPIPERAVAGQIFRTEAETQVGLKTVMTQPASSLPAYSSPVGMPLFMRDSDQVSDLRIETSERTGSQEVFGPSSVQTDALSRVQDNASPTSTSTQPAPLLRQIAEQLRLDGSGVIDLRLEPEELGRLRIAISAGEAGLNVQIIGDRMETVDLLRRNSATLERIFSEAGLDLASFGFSAGAKQEEQRHGAMADMPMGDSAALSTSSEKALSDQGIGHDGLDLRL